MTKKIFKTSIKKHNQSYILDLINKYPKINAGRKNYKDQYTRVLKNILLAKAYSILLEGKFNNSFNNCKFEENKNNIIIKLN